MIVLIDFQDYATSDDQCESSHHLSEGEIVETVRKNETENSAQESDDEPDIEETDNSPNIVNTLREFLNMILQQRAYLQRLKLSTEHIDELEQQIIDSTLARNKCQSNILSFFQMLKHRMIFLGVIQLSVMHYITNKLKLIVA